MMRSVVILISLISPPVFGAEQRCFIVSGAQVENGPDPDWFSSLFTPVQDMSIFAEPRIGTSACTVVSGWRSLTALVDKLDAETITQLIIVQAAHGDKRGVAVCDDGEYSAEQILDALDSYSKKFRIASYLTSCFSGDVMLAKIARDERNFSLNQNVEKSVENLCLISASLPRLEAYPATIDPFMHLLQSATGYAFQDVAFLSLSLGLLSSSPYASSGLGKYFLTRDLSDGLRALKGVNDLFRSDAGKFVAGPELEVLNRATVLTDLAIRFHNSDDVVSAFLDVKNTARLDFGKVTRVVGLDTATTVRVHPEPLHDLLRGYVGKKSSTKTRCLEDVDARMINWSFSEMHVQPEIQEFKAFLSTFDKDPKDSPCQKYAAKVGKQPSAVLMPFFPDIVRRDRALAYLVLLFSDGPVYEDYWMEALEGDVGLDDRKAILDENRSYAAHRFLENAFLASYESLSFPSDMGRSERTKRWTVTDLLNAFRVAGYLYDSPHPLDTARRKACEEFIIL